MILSAGEVDCAADDEVKDESDDAAVDETDDGAADEDDEVEEEAVPYTAFISSSIFLRSSSEKSSGLEKPPVFCAVFSAFVSLRCVVSDSVLPRSFSNDTSSASTVDRLASAVISESSLRKKSANSSFLPALGDPLSECGGSLFFVELSLAAAPNADPMPISSAAS